MKQHFEEQINPKIINQLLYYMIQPADGGNLAVAKIKLDSLEELPDGLEFVEMHQGTDMPVFRKV